LCRARFSWRCRQDRERASLALEASLYAVGTNNLIFLGLFLVLALSLPLPLLLCVAPPPRCRPHSALTTPCGRRSNYIVAVGASAAAVVVLTNKK
jgi:hypothetical protein